jgi:general secretion pathway protein D
VNPPLKNVTLVEALDAICRGADHPVSYAVEDYGVWFFVKEPEPVAMETRVFRVDTNVLFRELKRVLPQAVFDEAASPEQNSIGSNVPRATYPTVAGGNSSLTNNTQINETVRYNSLLNRYFSSLGLNVTANGAFAFFNTRTGDLLVRASAQDLDTVERVLEVLNKVPPQVRIDAKFVSLKQEGTNAASMWYLGNISPGTSGTHIGGPPPSSRGPFNPANPSGIFPGAAPSGSNPGVISPNAPVASDALSSAALRTTTAANATPITNLANLTGILTDSQFRAFIQAIEQRDGTDILSTPRITTLSGREARVAVTGLDVITATNAPTGSSSNTIEDGPALDVIPTVNADGYTIQLVLNASLRVFLGYDMPAQNAPQSNAVSNLQTGVTTNITLPVPRYRTFSAVTTVNVWDGQTVVLGGPMPERGPGLQQSTNTQSANLLIFITATIIDPAGNRVHTDEEMPFTKVSIPPQPQSTGAPKSGCVLIQL